MTLLLWIVFVTAASGVLSALAAGMLLFLSQSMRKRLMPALVSFAIGTMLAAALLGVLPEALEAPGADPYRINATVLVGLLIFFLLEKLVLWHHRHSGHEATEVFETGHAHSTVAAGYLILIGDAIHNVVDGVLIASAFLTDFRLGIVTSVAVVAHEIPQEMGDFVVLLNAGFSRARALVFNVLVSLTTVIGGVVAYFSLGFATQLLPYALAIAAASFIYISAADLIPVLHRRIDARAIVAQMGLIIAGIALIVLVEAALQ